jgi:hypothetical protein
MPDMLTWSIRVIFIFLKVWKHFINAFDKPAEFFLRDVLGNQFFH